MSRPVEAYAVIKHNNGSTTIYAVFADYNVACEVLSNLWTDNKPDDDTTYAVEPTRFFS